MIKVYLAILNSGYLRREIPYFVLPAMRHTKGVEITWEDPGVTWSNPISSNRNMIVKRFLRTDCDFLLMLDDDVVPLHNPAELVYANLDIVGFPARVRSTGQTIVWTAYKPHPGGEAYSAIDLTAVDDMMDCLEVDIVGTGCILVKRVVLETLKAPFHSEFDEDGIQMFGTDFAFCRKAAKAGFKIYTAPQRICEHYKTVGLNDIQGWDDIRHFDQSNTKYEIAWGGWAITQKDWKFIRNILKNENVKTVLEFGAGLSSLLMSEKYKVITYETDPDYAKEIQDKATGDLEIRIWDGVTKPELDFIPDIVFVDGPRGESAGGMGRRVSIEIAAESCDNILIHDAGRRAEQQHQRDILRGVFKRVLDSGDHVTRCNYWKRRSRVLTNADIKDGKFPDE